MVELRSCTTNFFPEICGVNVIVDPQSNLGTDDDKVLIIGQKSAAGTAADNSVQLVNEGTRGTLFGAGSMLNRMIDDFLQGCPTADLSAYVLPDGGVQGSADVVVSGVDTATTSGIVYLWVNGQVYQASFDPTVDTNDTLAANLGALVSNDTSLTVSVAADTITITTLGGGEVAGWLDVRTSYAVQGLFVPSAEVTLTPTVATGTGLPDLSGLSGLTDGYEFVVNPYTDATSMDNVSAYVCGQWSGGANSRAYGVYYGDAVAAQAFAQNENNALLSYMAIDGALTPPYLETASFGCLAYSQLNCGSDDIAASMTGQRMPALLAPELADRYSNVEKATLVESGIGYFDVNRINDVIIGRAVTTYTVRDNGSLDDSLRDINKPAIIACISRFLRENLTDRYTGYAFRADGVVGSGSSKVVTLAGVRNYLISLAQQLSELNLIQNLEGFVESLNVQIDPANGCIEVTVDPELVCAFCCLNVNLRTI